MFLNKLIRAPKLLSVKNGRFRPIYSYQPSVFTEAPKYFSTVKKESQDSIYKWNKLKHNLVAYRHGVIMDDYDIHVLDYDVSRLINVMVIYINKRYDFSEPSMKEIYDELSNVLRVKIYSGETFLGTILKYLYRLSFYDKKDQMRDLANKSKIFIVLHNVKIYDHKLKEDFNNIIHMVMHL